MVADIDRSKVSTTEGQLLLLINDKMDSIKNQENRIGDIYNFNDKKFYYADGTLVKTYAEIQAEIELAKTVQ